jgi:TonB family protein
MFANLSKEEFTGIAFSAAVHLLLLMLAFLVKLDRPDASAFSFIEVEFGEFRQGRATALSDKKNQPVETAKRPTPQNNASQKDLRNEKTNQQELAKPAELSKQTQDIKSDDVVNTAKTDQLNPEKNAEKSEREKAASAKNARQAEDDRQGLESSGNTKGKSGATTGQQGAGEDEDLSAPYSLMWEGDVFRKPLSDLKPNFVGEMDAVITVRFQVRPDGTVGQMVPLKKMSPELEREVMRVLRTARFSKLPSGAPQVAQWGTITFRFVLE